MGILDSLHGLDAYYNCDKNTTVFLLEKELIVKLTSQGITPVSIVFHFESFCI